MRGIFSVIMTFFSICAASAQDTAKKSKMWTNGARISVLGAQTGSRNWAPANEKFSITGIATVSLWADRQKPGSEWVISSDLNYGIANTSSGGPRKVEDKIDIFSRYTRFFKGKGGGSAQAPLTTEVHRATGSRSGLGITAGMRSQFSNSFDYSLEPKKRISGFFAPAYLVLSPGLHFKPSKELAITAGPAIRSIFVSNAPYSYNYQGGIKPSGEREKSIAEIYGVHPERESRFEAGVLLTASYNRKQILRNIDYKTRLEVMNDLLGRDATSLDGQVLVNRKPGAFDIYWTNSLLMNVNNWITVTYSYDLVYDGDVKIFGKDRNSAALQMRSLLGVGVVANF